MKTMLNIALRLLLLLLIAVPAQGFWVVNFGTALTLKPWQFGFAAGLGGQMVFVGNPRKANAFFMIPHAGFRLGLTDRLDIGLRLAPLPLPFSTVGPGFGMNLDAKYCFTPTDAKVQSAIVLGAGGAHVLIQEETRLAQSLNAALLVSAKVSEKTTLTAMGRYVNLGIPTAPEGQSGNFVNITGASLGLKYNARPNIAILPELGAYWYDGQINKVSYTGPGVQYGIMISTSI